MPDRIKVLPNDDAWVGMVHPIDGPLEAEGSLWTLDSFTARRLADASIIRFEQPVQAPAAPPPAPETSKTTKAEAAAAASASPDTAPPAETAGEPPAA